MRKGWLFFTFFGVGGWDRTSLERDDGIHAVRFFTLNFFSNLFYTNTHLTLSSARQVLVGGVWEMPCLAVQTHRHITPAFPHLFLYIAYIFFT